MRTPRVTIAFAVLAFISLLAQATPLAVMQEGGQSAGGTVLFSLIRFDSSSPVRMEPIVIINAGKYAEPPVDDEGGEKKFIADYFRPGRQYRVVFGGGDAGSYTVQKYVEQGCSGLIAEGNAQTTARLGGEVRALAVSSDKIGRGEISRRAPTDAERAAALDVARAVYAQRGVGAAVTKNMTTENLTATDIERDGKFELIGSFSIDGGNYVRYNLFVIFEPTTAGKYKAAWNWYFKSSESGYEDRKLVDAADLDGDGTAEVIAAGHYHEENDYIIYKRQAGTWRPIYKGGGGGC